MSDKGNPPPQGLEWERIGKAFGRLSQPVFLLDRQGRCVVPPLPDAFRLPEQLPEDKPVSRSGYLFLGLPGLEAYSLAAKDRPGAADLLLLAARLVQAERLAAGFSPDENSSLKRLLSGEISAMELEGLFEKTAVRDAAPRCALLVTVAGTRGLDMREALQDALPVSPGDLVVWENARSMVLARETGDETPEELTEFAMALLDTLQNELGLEATVGIGETVDGLSGLRASYLKARKALEIGRLFHPEARIHAYGNLLAERVLASLSPEDASRFAGLLFNRENEKLFNEEMLETIRVFIQRNLNLTDAARDLYIHRNTLVYRLDKVQRACGLDLRSFRDAMTFKMLSDLNTLGSTAGFPAMPPPERNVP